MECRVNKEGFIKSDIVLTVGMLVSNNISYIERCMEGLRPLLSAIPSELIIIDTVGPEKSDGSIDVCKRYTDNIFCFEWCNDFSAARNECIKRARGEWFMFQDDDEWFEDTSEFIRFFTGPEKDSFNSGVYVIRNFKFDGSYSDTIAGRLIRRRPDTRFVHKIHEGFNEVFTPLKQFSVVARHMGYLYVTEEDREKKLERNVVLLEEELNEEGLSPRLCAQIVQELTGSVHRQQEAQRLCMEYTDKLVESGYGADSCTQWLLCQQCKYHVFNKDGIGFLRQLEKVRKNYLLSKYAALVLDGLEIRGIRALFDENMYPERVLSAVDEYIRIYDYFIEHAEEKTLQVQLDFPQYSTTQYLNEVLLEGGKTAAGMNNHEKAYGYWKCVNWELVEEPHRFKNILLYTLQRLDDDGPLNEYYRHFMNPVLFEPGYEKYLPEDLRRLTKSKNS